MDQVLYTVSETAELLKVNRNSVYDLLRNQNRAARFFREK